MEPNPQQQQQPINPQSVQQAPQTIPTKSPLPKIVFALLGIIIVLGLVGGAYYLGTEKNTSNVSSEMRRAPVATIPVTSALTNAATPTPGVPANWKSYTAPDSYTFNYPNDNNWRLTAVNGSESASVDVQCPHIACPKPYNIYDFAGGIATTLPNSLDSYISSLNTTNPASSTHAGPYIQDYQKIKIHGLDAVETLVQTGKLAGSGPIVTIFVISKDKPYSFGYTYSDVNLNTVTKLSQLPKPNPDIVSTLQFTQ